MSNNTSSSSCCYCCCCGCGCDDSTDYQICVFYTAIPCHNICICKIGIIIILDSSFIPLMILNDKRIHMKKIF